MEKPIIAIIGRPNVGKSTLFNKIVGKRIAIVKDTPGVTRDRNYGEGSWNNKSFRLIDTGGFEPAAKEDIISQVMEQTQVAIEDADVIILLLDGKDGLMASDIDVSKILRRSGKRFVCAVNKIDDPKHSYRVHDFYAMGTREIFPISAEHSIGIDALLDKTVSLIPEYTAVEDSEDKIRIAIVGKPNVGKSSLINRIVSENRLVVSDIPGTTRDAIDTLYVMDNKKYIFVDTAGIRKKNRVSQKLEKYSIMMSMRSIERCDISVILVDAACDITEQDVKIAGLIHEAGKGAIVAINKWDMIEKDAHTAAHYTAAVKKRLKYMPYAFVITISALSGQRVSRLFPLIDRIAEEQSKKVPTSQLNKVVEQAIRKRPPSHYRGKPIKLYYAAQVKSKPPAFMFFVNYAEGIHFSYTRFLQNELRREFGFTGTPIVIVYKNRER